MYKNRWVSFTIWFLIVALWLLGATLGNDLQDSTTLTLKADEPDFLSLPLEALTLPPLALESLSSSEPVTTETLNASRVLLAFILPMPECPGCAELVDLLSVLSLAAPGAEFVIITQEDNEDLQSTLQPLLQSLHTDQPQAKVSVAVDDDLRLARLLRVQQVPTFFLLEEGSLVKRYDWPLQLEGFQQEVEQWLWGTLLPHSPLAVEAGTPAPEFSLMNEADQLISLSQLAKPLLLGFYTVDCDPSQRLLGPLMDFSLLHALPVYLIVLDSPSALRSSMPEGLPLPTLFDPEWKSADIFGLQATPTLILLDREGVIRWIQIGYRNDIEQVLEEMLGVL